MRIDLKKFLFVGATSSKSPFLKEAQQLGIIEFVEEKKEEVLSSSTKRLMDAIKILRGFPPQPVLTGVPLAKGEGIVDEIHSTYQTFIASQHSLADLEVEKREMAPFGRFDREQLERIEEKGNLVFQFFALKKGEKPLYDLILLDQGEELDSYVWIGKEPLHIPNAIEIPTNCSVEETERLIQEVLETKAKSEDRLEELTAYREFLLELLVEALDHDAYTKALNAGKSAVEGKAFSLIGWVPSHKIAELNELVAKSHIFAEEVMIKEGETVPTYLENEKWSRVGEDLVGIYDTPSSTDKDPSPWVLGFFVLFFSMIIGDAGYGLIFLLIALYIRWKHPNLKGLKQRVLNLFTLLSVGCIVWGVLVNGYFGIPFDYKDHPLKRHSLLTWLAEKKADYHLARHDVIYEEWVHEYPQIKAATTGQEMIQLATKDSKFPMLDRFTDQVMLELALLVGTIHLALSMARYATRNWALFGWIIFLIGGYLYIPYKFNYTSILYFVFGVDREVGGIIGKQLMIVGAVVVLILALIQHRIKGLLEAMTVIQILADVLSYLRLYALALAGGILSVTIFDMAQKMPLVLAVIVMFVGHLINMGLGVMGGVIHGLRLNFLEWYHYSFEGGGRPFRPLKQLKKK